MNNGSDNYKLSQCISSDGLISLYHAFNVQDQSSCIIKVPVDDTACEACTTFFENEFTLCSTIDNPWVLKSTRLIRRNNGFFAEYQHRDVIPFAMAFRGSEATSQTFINDAITMVQIVDSLHSAGIIHGNLSPHAFFKSISTGESFLTAFYVANHFQEHSSQTNRLLYYPPNCRYIAPEQTGNISRAIDERTDLYALGIIFYELLCGAPPFTDANPASLMYSHVARKPTPVHLRQEGIPLSISEIISKLLEKNPADRYQGADGLIADLEACRHHFETPPSATTIFTPGLKDRGTRLLPLGMIYGREHELRDLRDMFTDASRGTSRAIFFSGQAGIGKSRLVETFIESLGTKTLLVAKGKCDAASVNAPYHALKSAISDLIKTIISQGNHIVALWRDTFNAALGEHRSIIADFIPELQLIIGPCPQVRHTEDAEAGTLFRSTFITFLRSIPQHETPFVLFIDDLQWSDSALLDILVPAFFENRSSSLLFIGAGRQDPVTDRIISTFEKTPVGCSAVALSALTLAETSRILCDVLGASPESLSELSDMTFEKTAGNPFFLLQFIETLIGKKIIRLGSSAEPVTGPPRSLSRYLWTWNSDALSELSCTDNVIDLILDKVDALPERTLTLLTIAACIGLKSDCSLLALINDSSLDETVSSLTTAHNAGILRLEQHHDNAQHASPLCHFAHDRIREAIYGKIRDDEVAELHLRIGRKLLQLTNNTSAVPSAYEVVKHFNPFADYIIDREERLHLAKLNRQAALNARNSHAYQIALVHCEAAGTFLEPDAERTFPELHFSIEFLHAECEYLFTSFESALNRLAALEKNKRTTLELAHIDLLRMSIYDHTQRTALSLETGSQRLRSMGIAITTHPSIPRVALSLLKAALTIRSIATASQHVPESKIPQSEEMLLVSRILCRMWLNAFILQQQGVIIIIMTQMIALTRQNGVYGATSVALCFWGIFRGMLSGNPLRGLDYGNRALAIAQRLDDVFSRGITLFLYGSFFAYLKGHVDDSLEILSKGKQTSFDAGDFVSASNSIEGYLLFLVASGKKLSEAHTYAVGSLKFLAEIGQASSESVIPTCIKQWTENLQGDLNFSAESIAEQAAGQVPLMKGIIYFLSMFTATLVEECDTILTYVRLLRRNPLITPNSYFYFYLIYLKALSLSCTSHRKTSSSTKAQLVRCTRILNRAARLSPVNFSHCHFLVKAELARIAGRHWEALQSYQQALSAAENHGFILYAAISSERAARFMAEYNQTHSRQFLKKAITYYTEWGCITKAMQLRKTAPDLAFATSPGGNQIPGTSEIDLQALLKAFEAISTELRLDRLPEKLVRILMEHIGADRGVLLLEKDEALYVQAEGYLENSSVIPGTESFIETKPLNIPAEQYEIPQSVISSVSLSRDPVRLENAAEKGRFVHDEYFRKHRTKSVIAVPLLYNDRLRGIIYCENNITEGAFPPARLQLLRMLSSQAIISIENALFHEIEIKHLQAKVNPHFIFNALSSIAELCHQDATATEDAIIKLSTLYRYVLSAEMRMVTISEELDIVKKYLAIEKLRFGSRLTYAITTTGNVSTARIPSMIIQPLVENSIKHGISPRPSGGTITITIDAQPDICSVTVEDDGVGPGMSQPGTGYGLESIRKRLALHYGTRASIDINDTAGFRVRLSFPGTTEEH